MSGISPRAFRMTALIYLDAVLERIFSVQRSRMTWKAISGATPVRTNEQVREPTRRPRNIRSAVLGCYRAKRLCNEARGNSSLYNEYHIRWQLAISGEYKQELEEKVTDNNFLIDQTLPRDIDWPRVLVLLWRANVNEILEDRLLYHGPAKVIDR